ncbi:g10934 [Coccomyxa elongata]
MVVGSFTRLDCALLPSRPTPRALPSPIRCIVEPLLGDTRKANNGSAPATIDLSKSPFSTYEPEPWTMAYAPIEDASTPPSSWYLSPQVAELEKVAIFHNNWQMIGHASQAPNPGDYFTGSVADINYVVVRGDDGQLRAFHNICRHKAAPVAEGSGCVKMFECMYHGWQYDYEGRFRGATKLKGIKNFKAQDYGLVPIRLDTWGQFVFILADPTSEKGSVAEWLGEGGKKMEACDMKAPDLVHVRTVPYDLECNWKVFNDNYLDTCYHCPFAHPGLCAALDIDQYYSVCYEHNSFQFSPLAPPDQRPEEGSEWDTITANRIEGDGQGPRYTFVYPNVMVNRYSMWMGTMRVLPLGEKKTKVLMDYYVHTSKVNDQEWIDQVVMGEDIVQREDMHMCDLVQKGLASPAYDVGRYAPSVEEPVFHFHKLVHRDLVGQ